MIIFAAVTGAYCLLLAVRLAAGAIVWDGLPLILRILPAVAVVFGVGLVDDFTSLKPWKKLTAEVVAAVLAWRGGIHVTAIAGYSFSHVFVSFLVTIGWIVICTNAINLIDGVDGLAAGVSLFAAITMLIAALLNHNIPMALAVAPFAGALLGFLRYNFNPASIFLGDSGSLGLGFLLGCVGAVWSEKSETLLGLTAPLLVLAVPLIDVALSIVRRFLRGKPIFAGDRAHIHHQLLSRGLAPRRLVLLIYGVSGIGAAASLVLTASHDQYRGFVIVLVCLATWLGLQHLGYNEFGTVGRMVVGGTFRGVLSAQLALRAFEDEIRDDMTIQQCCEVMCRTCSRFGFSGMKFRLDDVEGFWGVTEGWQARIDFPERGYITLWRNSSDGQQGATAVLFIDCIARVVKNNLSRLESANVE